MVITSCTSIDYFHRDPNSGTDTYNENKEISIVTYNIKAIYEKEESQIDSLMSFVNSNKFDFVVFQELFDESTRDDIIEKAGPDFYNTFISRVDYNSFPEFIFQDAGLFMMSHYPRIDLSDIDFGDEINNSNGVIHMILEKEYSRTNDFLANKSVLGSLFDIDDSIKVFLFTAHVQAAGTTEHKEYQLSQIKDFIFTAITNVIDNNLVNNPKNLVVILAGDFNSNAYDNDRFAQFQKILGYPRDLHKEYHKTNEEYTFRGRGRRYDYVLTYDRIDNIELKNAVVKSINVEDIVDDHGESISDHRGIKADIIIN
jgi:endonuclease/exonuclease/phosphatase family metal-dependent hydrolase